jgi:6-phosphogluconate dehydrogenase (decarboxylating)
MKIGLVGVRDARLARRFACAGVRVFACGADDLAGDARIVLLPGAVAVAQALAAPRVVWLDQADGFATEIAIQDVWPECVPGDVIVDAGAGTPDDARRRAASLASARLHFVDCHVDFEGRLAFGGSEDAMRIVSPYADLAGQWTHRGPCGSGYHARLESGRDLT